jgi:dipeptidyl aminopeptidase/acylaminoacyl peptidase
MKKDSSSVKRIPIESFFAIRSTLGFTLSHDNNKIYYITNTTGSPQIWSIPLYGKGCPEQISIWNEAIKGLSHNPKKNELIFLSDNQGDEQLQIYRINLSSRDITHLTKGFEDSQCFYNGFNKLGDKFLFSTNKRLKYNFDVYIKDLKTGKNKLVKKFEGPYPAHGESWSSNERYITFLTMYGNINQDIFLYDTVTKRMINVTEHNIDVDVSNTNTKFNKNNTGFYYISDEGRNFKGIKYYDIKMKISQWFVKQNWDITNYTISKNFKYLLYTVNKNGNNAPKLKDLKTGRVHKLKLPKGNYLSLKFTKDENKIVNMFDNPLTPSDIFVYDLKNSINKQRTFSLVGGITKASFTKPVDIFYKSFDGLKIHALLYIPKGLKKNKKNPAIVWPHGGPEWQEMHNFSKYLQVIANAGYIVIAPNFRGSFGYGKKFQKMIYRDWGGAEFKDVLGSVDYLNKSGYVNVRRIGIVGGSFGGFMTLTCITKAPDIWNCAIDIFGPSNLFTFLKSIPEHWKKGTDRLVGDPVKDKKLLKDRSPINFVDKINCPLLVIQGRHDIRVVEAESAQIVKKLKSMNKPVEYILLEDEGHGFSKVSNQIFVFKEKLKFLDKYLK